jgi:hypothetical protein
MPTQFRSEALLRTIGSNVAGLLPGAERLASGLRLYLQAAAADRSLAQTLADSTLDILEPGDAVRPRLSADIVQAMRRGQVRGVSLEEALNLIAGAMLVALQRIARGAVPHGYHERMVGDILRSLGKSVRQAL